MGCEMRMMQNKIETRKVNVCVFARSTSYEDKVSSNQVHTIQTQKKLLTSFVGGTLGSTVGLDDGCSEDREQEISRKCGVKVSSKVK